MPLITTRRNVQARRNNWHKLSVFLQRTRQESDIKMTTGWAFDTTFNIRDNKRPSYVDTSVSETYIKQEILKALFDIEKPLSVNGFLERAPASTESERYVELERSWHDLIEQFRCTAYTKYTENNGPLRDDAEYRQQTGGQKP